MSESSYAPKSPDLSSFYSGATSDIPQSPNTPGNYPFQAGLGVGVGVGAGPGHGTPQRYNQPQPHHHQYGAYQQPAPPPAQPTSAPAYGNNTAFNPYSPPQGGGGGGGRQQGQYYSPRQQTQFNQPQTSQPPLHYPLQNPNAAAYYNSAYPESAPTSSTAYHQSQAQVQVQAQTQPSHLLTSQPQSPTAHDQFGTSDPQSAMPPRKIAPAAKQDEIEPSPVKTKFPTARIKRIMQADEEVGKVAQQTPIAVGKALELFMVQLVRKSAEVAKEKNSKRITAPMLKQAIGSTNEWDFLQDIVAKVGEEKEGRGAGRSKLESDSDEDVDVEVKKKGRGGRKKKAPA
ncbi:hypothetical protein F4677DRAFT_391249 [Hypoxylon crocopeplum]|nr:hypothetical protein F4677DRAFT_391249 [Hypoxylon crocopeplum]